MLRAPFAPISCRGLWYWAYHAYRAFSALLFGKRTHKEGTYLAYLAFLAFLFGKQSRWRPLRGMSAYTAPFQAPEKLWLLKGTGFSPYVSACNKHGFSR